MLPVIFHEEAALEASATADWYDQQQPGLSMRFENALRSTTSLIQENPLAYALESRRERYAPIPDFPYFLIFKIFPDHIWVIAVSHHKRREGYWRKRKPE
jgi:hypothetical protein